MAEPTERQDLEGPPFIQHLGYKVNRPCIHRHDQIDEF
jgi:hypothetical protein